MPGRVLEVMPMAKRVILLLAVLVSVARGQDLPDSPHQNSQVVATASDVYFTYRNMDRQAFHGNNPFARPFTQNRAILVASSAAGLVAEMYAERHLMRHGHKTLAPNLSWVVIGGHAFGACNSALHGGL